mgnify:CR=1 FL=1
MESSDGTWRGAFDAAVSEHDLVEYYWPPFRAAAQRANVAAVMCSYNAVNGVPSCANSFLMNTVARGQWGFDGAITSDCAAVSDIPQNHHYTNSSDATAAASHTAAHGRAIASCSARPRAAALARNSTSSSAAASFSTAGASTPP